MKPQTRNLTIDMQGADVAVLQRELRQLNAAIPDDEASRSLFGPGTDAAVQEFQRQKGLEATGVVDERTAAALAAEVNARQPRFVRGTVTYSDGAAAVGAKLAAFDRDLRHVELLGTATTGADGRYEITYFAKQFRRAEKQSADLLVRTIDGRMPLSSDIIFNARPIEIVDFILQDASARGESEYVRYLAQLQPLLEGVLLSALNEQDIHFLTGETGIEGLRLANLVIAHRHAATTKIDAQTFYGLFRQSLPTHLPTLLLQAPTRLRQALERSIAQNIIPERSSDDLQSVLNALRQQASETILRGPDGVSVPGLLGAAGLSADEQAVFLDAYLQHSENTPELWRSLESTTLAKKIKPLQASLQLGLLTANNAPLLSALKAKGVHSIGDLPRLGREGLRQLILGSDEILGAIEAEAGEINEQKAKRFANDMLEVLRAMVPTAFVRAAYEQSNDPVRRDMARVLANTPELELRDTHVDRFLAENPDALRDVADPEPVRRHLKTVQRVLRVAADAEHAELLISEGLDSAHAISSVAPDAFAQQFAEQLGGEAQARAYHQRAGSLNDAMTSIVGAIGQSTNGVSPGFVGGVDVDTVTKLIPNFTTLFGSQSFCSCAHCNSVLSPAAYLVDLLQFINPRAGSKPITVLRARRPDIERIPLTCENTNTPLPYVDLINEILEYYVAHGELSFMAAKGTLMSAEEVSLNPEHVVDAAYVTLAEAVYPQILPFHRPLTTMRLYLAQMGSSRYELMKTFRRGGQPTTGEIDLEFLKISTFERDILRGNTNKPLGLFYGIGNVDPSGKDQIKVAKFLREIGISYEELKGLLATRYLNPDSDIRLTDDEFPSRCDLEKVTLKNLTSDFWRRAYRFVRLQRKLAWSAHDIDSALTALQERTIGQNFLLKISVVEQLRQELKLTKPVLLSFWGDIDTDGSDALYTRLFFNKAVLNPPVIHFRLSQLQDSEVVVADQAAVILAALRISATDLEALMRHLGLTSTEEVLSLPLLSALHRHVALARALRLSIQDFLSLLMLTGKDPFEPGNPSSTLDFVERVRVVKKSGFTVGQLRYLYLCEHPNPFVPPEAGVRALFNSLRDGLRRITDQAPQLLVLPDQVPSSEALTTALPLVLPQSLTTQATSLVEKPVPLDATDLAFISTELGFLGADEANALAQDLSPDARRTRVVAGIVNYLRRDVVLQTLAENLSVEPAMVGTLLENILVSQIVPGKMALHDFLAAGGLPDEALSLSYLRLHKAAMLAREFGVNERELTYLHGHAADFGGLDLNALPLQPADFSAPLFVQWQRLARYVEFVRYVAQRDATVIDVFEAAQLPPEQNPREQAISRLKLATGWDSDEVDFLCGPQGLDLDTDDFKNEARLISLQRRLRLSTQLGVSCAQLFRWAGAEPDAADAKEVVSAAKANYPDEQWPVAAKPLNDSLRESSKEALIAYTLDHRNLSDSNQLYERFLIDVEMGSCMKTSRIKQAISSVQLFIQRCLMNLESAVSPSAIDADQWQWMKNYRVWEANRKVFLYPENWIEPELRDDKSPIFRELESELMQGDLDANSAEQALRHYLEKLDRVASLEPCGLYVQEADAESGEIVHMFGRTKTEPRSYYYRRYLNGRTWTAWEPVDVDIEGDHLMPIVHDRRLYLFWLSFELKQNEKQEFKHGFVASEEHYQWRTDYKQWRIDHKDWQDVQDLWKRVEAALLSIKARGGKNIDIPGFKVNFTNDHDDQFEKPEPVEPQEPAFSNPPPIVHWEIKLSWVEYHNGRWTAKRTSTESLISPMVARRALEFDGYWAFQVNGDTVGVLDHEDTLRQVATSPDTIAAAFLPEEHTHLVTTSVSSGSLLFTLKRRYKKEVRIVNQDVTLKGLEHLGNFELFCGSKVKTKSARVETSFRIPGGDYDNLSRPDNTTNRALTFPKDKTVTDPSKLSFTYTHANTLDILSKPIAGDFSILYEHARYRFSLLPPYQDFFYRDTEKTYYARYQLAEQKNRSNVNVLLGGSLPQNDALTDSFNRRLAPPLGNLQRRSGGQGVVVQNQAQHAEPSDDLLAGMTTDTTAVRALARGGIKLQTRTAQMTFGTMNSGWTGEEASQWREGLLDQTGLRFHTFFHPHVCKFTESLYRQGVPGLLSLKTQMITNERTAVTIFEEKYAPSSEVARPYPHETVDFAGGAYSLYNWELFFHAPLLVATSLAKNQRFAEALSWFHFIFNPTNRGATEGPGRYWNTLPFYKNAHPENEQIYNLLLTLAEQGPGWEEVAAQIAEWRDNPFNPHLIARMRITAYQKNVVMKYIDTLIAWGDQLFTRDTLESINEATLLYVLAYNILGPRPKAIPKAPPNPRSYFHLKNELDAFGNALVEIENVVPNHSNGYGAANTQTRPSSPWSNSADKALDRAVSNSVTMAQMTPQTSGAIATSGAQVTTVARRGEVTTTGFERQGGLMGSGHTAEQDTNPSFGSSLTGIRSLYFCVPQNDQLLSYWDTVDDRLFKIRNCMNIEGMLRDLPLFEPPIDPALLVRATAAGLDIGSVLNDLYAPLPRYRFAFMVQKAQELCGELKSLGGALLSALEKKDAEALSNLRAQHETALLKEVREVRRQQVAEGKANLEALNKSLEATQHRRSHYESLLSQGLIAEESEHMWKLQEAQADQINAQNYYLGAQLLSLVPDITSGQAGMSTPVSTFTFGGSQLSAGASMFAKFHENSAANTRFQAEMSAIIGGHHRRQEEWGFQVSSAQKEITQISRQIVAAEIRQSIAEKELVNHDLQIENSQAVGEFLRGKYTNEDLYGWMSSQVSKVYFQTYKLACDMAKRAERAYRFELGLTDTGFVQSGHWDSLKKGLLAGEQLSLDLKRMESAYLEQNKREYEITKNVSLLLHNPMALIELKTKGVCEFSLPEALFDVDYPGHYMRRLKTVSLSIPCVTGPYASINCTLTLTKNETRIKNVPAPSYLKNDQEEDDRFVANFAAQQSIATSHAQNDAGMFELNFRDERYLPFEGAGADSGWKIELPRENNAFDFDTVSDVVLHVKYTAREGGGALRAAAKEALSTQISDVSSSPLARLFSLRSEFSTEWYRFLSPPEPDNGAERVHRIVLNLQERFPFLFRGREIGIHRLHLYLKLKHGYTYDNAAPLGFELLGNVAPPLAEPVFVTQLAQSPAQFQLLGQHTHVPVAIPELNTDALPLVIAVEIPESSVPMVMAAESLGGNSAQLLPDVIDDIWLVCEYAVGPDA